MKPTTTLQAEYQIPPQVLADFKSYVQITGGKDKIVAAKLTDVFATNVHQAQGQGQQIYNNFDITFAVGMVMKLLVEQDIEIFDYLMKSTQKNEKQTYAFQILNYTVFQLDKSEIDLYLNCILANKNIPNQPLQDGISFSKIYSFVYMCELHTLFKPFQTQIKYQIFIQNEQYQLNQDAQIYFYKANETLPILVLLKGDVNSLQYTIFQNHKQFLLNVSAQLILDVATKTQSTFFKYIQGQPFRFSDQNAISEYLFAGQPFEAEKREQWQKIVKGGEKILKELILQGTSFEQVRQQFKNDQDQEFLEQLKTDAVSDGVKQAHFDVFATQAPQNNQASQNEFRRTNFY